MTVKRTPEQLRRDAMTIWRAGVAAVDSERLVRQHVRVRDGRLEIDGERLELSSIGRIVVVGAGKAGAGMAAGLLAALGPRVVEHKHLTGWINVPADCVRPLAPIHLHAARPPGVNEPTPEGAHGALEIMRMVSALGPEDLCISLLSGGGSALLPLPLEEITLDDKLAVTRFLSAAGAPIDDLNTVRKALSRIKGGNLARACRAGHLAALVISDVLGDPLDLIASGPTVEDRSPPEAALAVLNRYGAREAGIDPRVFEALARRVGQGVEPIGCLVTNTVIGNNQTAVAAAGDEARRLGYGPAMVSAKTSEGAAEDVGRDLAEAAVRMLSEGPDCLASGGEPTVKLVDTARRGRGGRNQQLVLSAALQLEAAGGEGIVILSGGTDGEDGPTDAAGAWVDRAMIDEARRLGLEARDFLQRNDAYRWFDPLGGLIKTGPTDTNVCDLRVVLVDRIARET